jgi:uncharacterized membrane protein YkoI
MRFEARSMAVALIAMSGPGFAQDADDGAVGTLRVPALVRRAADKAAPGAKLAKAAVEVKDDGRMLYKLVGIDAKDREIEVEVTDQGHVLAVETRISMRQVPKPVIEALRLKTRGLKLDKAESVTRGGHILGYEFEGQNDDGNDVEVNVSRDGTTVRVDVFDKE